MNSARLVFPARSAKAFSLVELLVVIAIIAVLAALLIPAAKTVAQKSSSMQCASNLRQIGTAIQAYAVDNDNYIVPWRLSNGGSSYWSGLLTPYMGAKYPATLPPTASANSVFMCPVKKANGNGITEYSVGTLWLRYNINLHVAENALGTGSGSASFRKVRMSQVNLSRTYIVMDLFGPGGGGSWCTSSGELTYPHSNRINVLFLDNHIEALDAIRMNTLGSKPYHIFWRGYDWGLGGYSEE